MAISEFKVLETITLLDPTFGIVTGIVFILIILYKVGFLKLIVSKLEEKKSLKDSLITEISNTKTEISDKIKQESDNIKQEIEIIKKDNEFIKEKLDDLTTKSNYDIVMKELDKIKQEIGKTQELSEDESKELMNKLYELEKEITIIKTILNFNTTNNNVGSFGNIK